VLQGTKHLTSRKIEQSPRTPKNNKQYALTNFLALKREQNQLRGRRKPACEQAEMLENGQYKSHV
jgi:hypothetical protein